MERRVCLRFNVFLVQRKAAFEDGLGFAELDGAVLDSVGHEKGFKGLLLLWPEPYPLFALAPALRKSVSEPQ